MFLGYSGDKKGRNFVISGKAEGGKGRNEFVNTDSGCRAATARARVPAALSLSGRAWRTVDAK